MTRPKGGQFVLHAKALHGNPYDGHTLGPVIADLQTLTGLAVRRIHVDKGYRADSDEVARAFRDDAARYSDMMSPRAGSLAGG